MKKSTFAALWELFFMIVITPMLLCIVAVFFGAFLGWFIGLFFGETIIGIFAQIGIVGFSMWQIGAFLGFISCFFKNMITYNTKRKA